jgi:uncharacterized protein
VTEKNAIIVHGMPGKEEYYDCNAPSGSNHHWLPWLQKQLIVHGVSAHAPEIPNSWDPYYPTWQREFERFDVGPQTILVGHSCGSGFLVRWLSEHKEITVGPVILVAPWLDPRRRKTREFFEFEMDLDLAARAAKLTIFNSDNDDPEIHDSARTIRERIRNVDYREFHNYGHFCLNDMNTTHFPELLEAALASKSE